MRPLPAIRTVHIDCEHRTTAHAWRTLPTLEICSLGRLRTLVPCTDTRGNSARISAVGMCGLRRCKYLHQPGLLLHFAPSIPSCFAAHTYLSMRAEDPERSAQGMFACNPALAACKDS